MPEAIIIREYGGSDRLVLENIDLPDPAPDEVTVHQTAVGVNYHDVYVRSGLYKTLALPGIPGCEAAGVIEAVGANIKHLKPGDRIAYVTGIYGAYTSHRTLPAQLAVSVPDDITDETCASNLLRAMTVEMLTAKVCQIKPGMTVLVHAAAGGVGRMLCQALSNMGATVIGTVGSAQKARVAEDNGCDHVVLYREDDFTHAVAELTTNEGVDVVYDSVGADTLTGSMESLKLCGHLVNFGQSSGPTEPVAMATLAAKSLTVSRPILFHYLQDPEQYQAIAGRVMQQFQSGILKAAAPSPVPLKDASRAHDTLENMTGGGSLILIP